MASNPSTASLANQHSPLRTPHLFDPYLPHCFMQRVRGNLKRCIKQCGLALHLSFNSMSKKLSMPNCHGKSEVGNPNATIQQNSSNKVSNRTSRASVKQHRHGLQGCHSPTTWYTVQAPLHVSHLAIFGAVS